MRKTIIASALVAVFALLPAAAAFGQGLGAGAPVQGTPVNKGTINGSVVITTGNTFQAVLVTSRGAVNANGAPVQRSALTIQNNNATDTCWITFGTIAGVTVTAANASKNSSIELLAGQGYTRYWPFVPNDEIEATCATTSDTLYVDTQ
jgi:hypothetical protein